MIIKVTLLCALCMSFWVHLSSVFVAVCVVQRHLQRTPTPYPKELKRRLQCSREWALSRRLSSGSGRRSSADGVRLFTFTANLQVLLIDTATAVTFISVLILFLFISH